MELFRHIPYVVSRDSSFHFTTVTNTTCNTSSRVSGETTVVWVGSRWGVDIVNHLSLESTPSEEVKDGGEYPTQRVSVRELLRLSSSESPVNVSFPVGVLVSLISLRLYLEFPVSPLVPARITGPGAGIKNCLDFWVGSNLVRHPSGLQNPCWSTPSWERRVGTERVKEYRHRGLSKRLFGRTLYPKVPCTRFSDTTFFWLDRRLTSPYTFFPVY